ncbi:Thaumatin-like protein [Thalictrum thalictroides]|uniref:Thaumatin-like protein n=1 Tax=Thalictrum thalictroides TaxID=46969 RepID=A0A7J6VVA5_THATH|nr:Thaumatin-like protein [Thalictrum thalictroides]
MKLLLILVFSAQLASGVLSATFTFKNNCRRPVWPGTLSGGGTPQLSTTGFQLNIGESKAITTPPNWSGRFWARTHCRNATANGKFICRTADCASGKVECNGAGGTPPATLIEFTLAGAGNQDFYDVSNVDGYNIPVSVTPQGSGSGCKSTSCPTDINKICPPELSVKGKRGKTTFACQSACEAFNHDPKYCCSGTFATPQSCPPTNYSMIFKNACPQAYSYAYDDRTSTFTCGTGADYLITFCP